MMRFAIAMIASVFLGTAGQAATGGTGLFEDLEFVATTEIRTTDGRPLSLCHTTDDLRLFGITVFSNISGYALADENCTGTINRRFDTDDVRRAQIGGLINPDIPPVAKNDVERNLKNYGIWTAIILGLVAVIIRRVKSLLGLDLRGPLRKKTTRRIIAAMCHAANADGVIDSRDLRLIRKTVQRVTRRAIRASEVVNASNHVGNDLTDHDYIALGQGLRDGEKDVMMQAVFYLTLSRGKLLPAEYLFLTRLAYGIGMPGEDFRRVMNLALTDLDLYPPA